MDGRWRRKKGSGSLIEGRIFWSGREEEKKDREADIEELGRR
jgi:hypothetical protein